MGGVLPADFLGAVRPRRLDEAALRWAAVRSPFVHWLLTTPELTTPVIEARCGARLGSRREVGVRDGKLVRRHLLILPDGGAAEAAEVEIPPAFAAWAGVRAPLGPWLGRQGWRLVKRDIVPLAFPNVAAWQTVFRGTAGWLELPGRSYTMEATRGGMSAALRTVEVWNPVVVR